MNSLAGVIEAATAPTTRPPAAPITSPAPVPTPGKIIVPIAAPAIEAPPT